MLRECLYFVSGMLGGCLRCQKCLEVVFSVMNARGCLQCKEYLGGVFSVSYTWRMSSVTGMLVFGGCFHCQACQCLTDIFGVRNAWMMFSV